MSYLSMSFESLNFSCFIIASRVPSPARLQIVRTKRYSIPPMTTESAMDELLNVGHDFFAFRSIETGELLNTSRGTPGASQAVPRADSLIPLFS